MTTEKIIWHKHALLLLSSIAVPCIQALLPWAVPWYLARELAWLYLRVGFIRLFSITLFLCSVWTILHIAYRARRPPPEDETTRIGRRRALLQRVVSPKRPLIIGFVILVCLLTDTLLLLSLFEFIPRPLGFEAEAFVVAAGLVYYGFLAGWTTVEAVDWRNDVYILTKEMIIDEVRVPALFEDRVMAPLDRVQNVSAETNPGILGMLLQVGKVEIETAAIQRAVIFADVHRPHDIQRVIFEWTDDLEERRRQEAREERTAELKEWFVSYYDLVTRVQILDSPDVATAGRPFSITWRVFTSLDTTYATMILWDTVSRSNGAGYRDATPAIFSAGSGTFRAEITPWNPGIVFFRACLDAGEEYRTAEHHVRVM